MVKAMGLLLAANTETVVLLVAAWFGSEWLQARYPLASGWLVITLGIALVVIGHTWFRVVKIVLEMDRTKRLGRSERKK